MRRSRLVAALCAVCAGSLLCAGCGAHRAAGEDAGGTARVNKRAPVVMVLGDSYTMGTGHTMPYETYAAKTAQLLDWQVVIAGHAGSGFVAPGTTGTMFQQMFDQQLAWRPAPSMVIIAGGHNDWPYPPSLIGQAATRLIDRVTTEWPHTRLVLVGPMWGSGKPVEAAYPIRDTLAADAARAKIPFIDPLGEHWITGDRSAHTGNAWRYIRSDNTHPTPAGETYFARRLATDLERLGLADEGPDASPIPSASADGPATATPSASARPSLAAHPTRSTGPGISGNPHHKHAGH